jgi:ABC-2 type transport system permease protein
VIVSQLVWAFFRRDLLLDLSFRFSLLLPVVNITITMAGYVFLSRLVEKDSLVRWTPAGEGYFPFVVVGMGASGAMVTALGGLARGLQLQQSSGVLKQLFFGQTRPEVVVLLSSVYPLVRGGVELVLYLAVGWFFGGLSLAGANLVGALVVAGLALVAFASLGLWAAAFSVLFRLGNPFVWVIGSSSWLLSGVLYPPALLPAPLRWAAELFPLTHALDGLRAALLTGAPLQELAVPALWLAGFILLVAPSGLAVFNAGLTRTRIHGTLVGG